MKTTHVPNCMQILKSMQEGHKNSHSVATVVVIIWLIGIMFFLLESQEWSFDHNR
jgi:hypothetical protein